MGVVAVCGFGRCGSSLVMQMLDAGGYPVFGEWPAYEESIQSELPESAEQWLAAVMDRATKALDPHRWRLPPGPDYKVIWLDRNPLQQAASQIKLMRLTCGFAIPNDRATRRKLAASYSADRAVAMKLFRDLGAAILELPFEVIILDRIAAAESINRFLGGGLDEHAMAAQVRHRGTDCLPGLLEANLIAEREQAA